MAGILLSLILAAGMFGAIWGLGRSRRKPDALRRVSGQLSAAERRRLYKRLGIDPALLARRQRSNVTRLDPDRSRTRA
jgi:hypothetical protein